MRTLFFHQVTKPEVPGIRFSFRGGALREAPGAYLLVRGQDHGRDVANPHDGSAVRERPFFHFATL